MTDIYDRALWPTPDENPLVQLFENSEDWVSNKELVAAFGLAERRAMMSNQTAFVQCLAHEDTAVWTRDSWRQGVGVSRSNGGTERVYSKKALILAAMRVNTVNAAAFRDWLANRMVEVCHG